MSAEISPMAATAARFLYSLPIAWLYLALILGIEDSELPAIHMTFAGYAVLASVGQIIATILLIRVLSRRNFAIGTTYAKTEAIQTAILGALLFSLPLTPLGWISVCVGVIGLSIISTMGNPSGFWQWPDQTARIGILSGLSFSLTSLWLRQASLSLGSGFLLSAAITLVTMITVQTGLTLIWMLLFERRELLRLFQYSRLGWFIGLTSVLGSIGWFTAMTLENPAYVKTLGQVEYFFTLIITYRYFGEGVTKREYWGIALIIVSVVGVLIAV